MTKCFKCKKELKFYNSKGYDIGGHLLCGECWNNLDDDETQVMINISSKEEYTLKKSELKKELKNMKQEQINEKIPPKKNSIKNLSKEDVSEAVFYGVLKIVLMIIGLILLIWVIFKPHLTLEFI